MREARARRDVDARRVAYFAALVLTGLLALAFLYAEAYETVLAPCATGASCSYDSIAAPWLGALAAAGAGVGLLAGRAMRARMPPAGWVVLPLLAALFAGLVVAGGQGPWIGRLWLPLFVLALVDASVLVWMSIGT